MSSLPPSMHAAESAEPASAERRRLLDELMRELRDISTTSVMFSQTIASRVGLNPTDLETLGIVAEEASVTAGRLAERTGLTTGAITGVVDRLERAGWVRRERDPHDRRRVFVLLNGDQAERRVYPHFVSQGQAMADLFAAYRDDQLALILDFVRRGNAITLAEITRLRDAPIDS